MPLPTTTLQFPAHSTSGCWALLLVNTHVFYWEPWPMQGYRQQSWARYSCPLSKTYFTFLTVFCVKSSINWAYQNQNNPESNRIFNCRNKMEEFKSFVINSSKIITPRETEILYSIHTVLQVVLVLSQQYPLGVLSFHFNASWHYLSLGYTEKLSILGKYLNTLIVCWFQEHLLPHGVRWG